MGITFGTILETLQAGLPVLLVQLAAALLLWGVGLVAYMAITPFNEHRLIRQGNCAAGTVLAGTAVALAIPLAATLATSALAIDILLWGAVALVLQLLIFAAASLLVRGLREMIEAGNVAAALVLSAVQIAVALLNAGAMAG